MKKIIGIFIVTLLIGTVYSTVGLEENTSSSFNNSIDVEDQKNTCSSCSSYSMEMYEGKFYAQGFTPSKTPLIKVYISIGRYGDPPENANLTFSIRDSLEGADIVSSQFHLDDLTGIGIEFSFPDIDVTIGNIYYIVCSVDKGYLLSDCYNWKYSSNDLYEGGDGWYSANGISWYPAEEYTLEESPGVDFGFTTYWRDYAPNDPEIDGPAEGKAQERYDYTFSTIDPEGNDVEYYIEWGDGKSFKWAGPYESGEQAIKSHRWTYEDNYTIRVKARDIYGAESEWATLEVSMPKNKAINTPFLQFLDNMLQNYPNLFPLLRQLLGL